MANVTLNETLSVNGRRCVSMAHQQVDVLGHSRAEQYIRTGERAVKDMNSFRANRKSAVMNPCFPRLKVTQDFGISPSQRRQRKTRPLPRTDTRHIERAHNQRRRPITQSNGKAW